MLGLRAGHFPLIGAKALNLEEFSRAFGNRENFT
jgi:hypothetical protein